MFDFHLMFFNSFFPKKQFKMASKLFIKKWQTEEPEFAKYFQNEWIIKNGNWYEGAARLAPSTNNGLESFNSVIKKEATFRKRLSVADFTQTLCKLVEDSSKDYKRNIVTMATEPNISRKQYTTADEWLNSYAAIVAEKESDEEDKIVYHVKSTKNRLSERNVLTYEEIESKRWELFDQYIKFGFGLYYETVLNRNNWKIESTCQCPDYMKNYICKL